MCDLAIERHCDMRISIGCVWFFLLLSLITRAQFFFYNDKFLEKEFLFEISTGLGAMNCFTDIGGNKGIGRGFIKDLDITNFHPSVQFAFLLDYKGKFTTRIQYTSGKIAASDHRLKDFSLNSGGRYQRNLSFRSDINEFMLLFDVSPVTIGNGVFSPYISSGLSIYYFSPMAKLDGNWYHLQPLRTEGQGIGGSVPYDLTQVALPLSAGFRADLSAVIRIRFQITHRILFTDYLDDVSKNYIDPKFFLDQLPLPMALIATRLHDRRSELDPGVQPAVGQQRGDPSDKDSWFTIDLMLSYCFRPRR